jgi:hypothetical protein
MAKLIVEIELTNDAFVQGSLEAELREIMNELVDRIGHGKRSGMVKDSNGNRVGSWGIEGTFEEE